MITIKSNIYRAVAEKLLTLIAESDYFNGTIEYDDEELYATFRATLIIYAQQTGGPDGSVRHITNIVPVWWEFNTFQQCGQVLNDFMWDEFKQHLL